MNEVIGSTYAVVTTDKDLFAATLVAVKQQHNGERCLVFDAPEWTLPCGFTTAQIATMQGPI